MLSYVYAQLLFAGRACLFAPHPSVLPFSSVAVDPTPSLRNPSSLFDSPCCADASLAPTCGPPTYPCAGQTQLANGAHPCLTPTPCWSQAVRFSNPVSARPSIYRAPHGAASCEAEGPGVCSSAARRRVPGWRFRAQITPRPAAHAEPSPRSAPSEQAAHAFGHVSFAEECSSVAGGGSEHKSRPLPHCTRMLRVGGRVC